MKSRISTYMSAMTLLAAMAVPVRVAAQEPLNESATTGTANPIPFINQPLVPDAIKPGGAGFTLTVSGTGFILGSVVKWNGSARTTIFVSSSLLKANILASDIAKPSTASVTVANPTPGGGSSNAAFFEVTTGISSLTMSTSNFVTGVGSNSVVIGDFNRDGKLDLAVANIADNTVSVLLGHGDGTFRPAVNYRAGSGLETYSMTVGDFNRDGKLDLAVTEDSGTTSSGSVSVLLGNGDGTFQMPVSYSVGASPTSVAVGDFNRDGNLDLAVANFITNNGDGTFQPRRDFSAGGRPTAAVTVGDFNGDGVPDLAVAIRSYPGPGGISVLLGYGDGTFQSAAEYGTLSSPLSVAVGDFNRDGKLDLVVANSAENGGIPGVSVLLGNGDGTFRAAVNYGAGSFPFSVVVGDFNADRNLDLAVANLSGSNVSILLGRGDGTFQAAVNYGAGSSPQSVAMGDFNGDGKLDLAVANNSGTASILLGNGNGTFQAPTSYRAALIPVSVAVGDFNGDGNLDLAVADYNGSSPASVSVLLQATVVSLSTTRLTFADQVIGTSSAHQTVTVTNTGHLTLKVASISITGKNAADFSQANNCGTGVSPGGHCTISVTFKPIQAGPRMAAVTIMDNAVGSPQTVALSGTGLTSGPNATLSPTSISFTTQVVGTTSPAQSATLINYGVTTLSIAGIAITGTNANNFAQTHTCGTSLTTGASCSISITFKPTNSGNRTAAVNITDNAVGSPQKVTLSGVGTIAKLSPLSLSFGSVVIDTTSPSQTVTLTNVGTTTLSIIGIGITGTNAGNFAQTHTCGTSLVAGASCSISVTFKPTALGTRTATLNISDNGGGSPQRVSLSGTGVAGRCSPRGTQCAPQFPPCCPGLKCTFLGNRAFCEP